MDSIIAMELGTFLVYKMVFMLIGASVGALIGYLAGLKEI